MKKYLIIFCLIFISTISLAQWTAVMDLQFTIQSQSKLNAFVDVNGVHIVYWRNGGIKYARANSSGTVLYYDKVIESEGANCDFVNIVSVNNNYLYAIYKKNNTINVARSTNSGNSWTNNYSSRIMTNTGCDKMVAYNDGSDIHIGWTQFRSGSQYFRDSYYIKFQTSPIQWLYYKEVTDQEWDGGNDPDLAISSNKIHYLYKDGSSDSRSRDKVRTSPNWDDSQYIPFTGTSIEYHKPVVANNEINAAFRVYYSTFYVSGAFISNSDRPFDQGFWNENVWLRESEIGYETEVESTVDNKIHFIYFDKDDYKWEHRYVSGSTLSGQIGEIYLVALPSSSLIANSNDLFLLALGSDLLPAWPKMQHYDVAPLAPTNLTSYLDPEPYCNDCHGSGSGIRLDWDENNEPDLSHYIIYRAEEPGNCSSCHGSSGGTPEDSMSVFIEPVTVQQDCPALSGEITNFTKSRVEVETGCQSGLESTQKLTFNPIWAWSLNWWMDQNIQEDYTYYYFVTAVDVTSHESDQSNITETYVPVGGLAKPFAEFSSEIVPRIFFLYQNYPNPFNPVTTIRYQVPKETSVMIEIFNMLGQKVRTLVNEFKAEGYYSVEWNGKNDFEQPLPSGIYLYKMTAGSYSETKKMLLLK